MAEQIGLEGIFDMSSFDRGIQSYLSKLKQAENNTEQTKGSFGSAFDTMGKKVLDTSVLIGKTFVAATAAATAAVGAFVVRGIKQASDLESQMGGIASIMGETKEAVGPLKDLIMDLGLDPTLKVNATEAADAIEKLASNGLSMTQIMEGAAKNTVLLANSTGADFDTAAAIATDTMALFNIEANEMMEAVNGITGVTVASKFGINDYRLALSQAGGVAAATGVEFDDFNTTITGISNYFASGSDAGTSFKTMLLRLVPASDAAGEMMQKIGLTTFDTEAAMKMLEINGVKPLGNSMGDLWGQLYNVWAQSHETEAASDTAAKKFNEWARETGVMTNAFFDSEGQMKSMNEISMLLNDSLKDLSEEEKNKALSTIFGTDAMRAAVGIAEQGEIAYTDQATAAKELGVSFESLNGVIDGGITKFEALQVQIQNTDAAESAKVRMDNFKGSLEILQGVIDTVALQIGFAFLPMLKELADRASELISQHAPAIIAFFESFAAGIENVVSTGNWSAIFPDWLTGIIELVTNNLDLLLGALGGIAVLLASAGIAAAFTTMGAAMAAVLSPIGLLVIGAAALGAAWNTNFLGMKDATFAVIEPLQNFIEVVMDAGARSIEAQEALTLFPEALQGIISNIAITVENILNYIAAIQDAGVFSIEAREALTLFPEVLQGLIGGLVETIASIWNYIAAIQDAGLFSSEAKEALGLLLASFWTLIGGVGTLLGAWTTTLASWASAITEQLMAVDYYQLGMSILGLIRDGWVSMVATVMPTLTAFGNELGLKIRAIDWAGIGSAILDLIKQGWTSTVNAVIPLLAAFGTELSLKIRSVDWLSLGTSILNLIKDGWSAAVAGVTTVVTNWTTSVKNIISTVDWKSVGSTLLNMIKEGWESVKAGALIALSAIASTWKLQFGDAIQNWTQAGKDILDKVKAGLDSAKTTILTTISTIANDMKSRYLTPEGFQWGTLGQDISNLIRDGFNTAAKGGVGIIAIALTIATSIKDQFTTMTWGEIGTAINDKIKIALQTAVNATGGLIAIAKQAAVDAMNGLLATDWEELGRSMARLIKDGFTAIAEGIGGLIPTATTVGTSVSDAFTSIDWIELGKTILNGIVTGVKAIAYGAAGLIYVVAGIVKGFTEELFNVDWDMQGQNILNAIKTGVETAKTTFMTMVRTIPDGIKAIFTEYIQTFKNIGADIVNGIGSGITGAKDELMKKAQELANSLPGWVKSVLGISSPSKVFAEIGKNIVQGLISGIEQSTGELQNVLEGLFGNLSFEDLAKMNITVTDQFTSRAEGILNPLKEQLKALGEANELEQRRLEIISDITGAYGDATDDSQLDDKTLERVMKLSDELDEVNDKIATRVQLEKKLQDLSALDTAVQQLRERQDQISLMENYLGLLEQAGTLGFDISKYPVFPDDTLTLLQSMIDLETNIASIRTEQLRLQSLTLQQTLEERRIAKDRAMWLERTRTQLQGVIARSETGGFFSKLYKSQVLDPILKTLENVAEVEVERNQIIHDYIQQSGKLQRINYFENEASLLEQRVNLLKQAADLGIDISSYKVDYDKSTQSLQEMVDLEEKITLARIGQLQQQGTQLKLAQAQALAEQKRLSAFNQTMNSMKNVTDRITDLSGYFSQLLKTSYLDPLVQRLREVADVDSERVRLAKEYYEEATKLAYLQFLDSENDRLNAYVGLLQEANDLGIDITNMPRFPSTDKATLDQIVQLEKLVSAEKYRQLLTQIDLLKIQAQQDKQFEGIRFSISHVEKYNNFLNEQLGLMKQANDLGLDLSKIFSDGIIRDPNDTGRLLQLQWSIAAATGTSLENELNGMIAEQKRIRGLESALQVLQPLIDQTNVSSVFGQRYKATVVDPLLRALEKAAGIDSERVRLMNEYTAAAQKLAEINRKEEQLNFLNQQLDVIKMIQDQDLVGGNSLFEGIAFGVNASIDDLLTLTNRVLNSMITEVKDELGIHSPSEVFAQIGEQMMAGLNQGIRRAVIGPMNSLRESTVAQGEVSTRTLNFAMGGVNIYTPMDEVVFENRVMRILERVI